MNSPEFRDGSLHIPGFPDAIWFAEIPAKESARLAHLTLHRTDLHSAWESLDLLGKLDESGDLRIVRDALFKWSLTSFFKCFQKNNARTVKLLRNDIYKEEEQQKVFDYFKDLRNKTVVHDENGLTQCAVGAVVNPPATDPRVPAVLSLPAFAGFVDAAHIEQMILLVNAAIVWTESAVDDEHDRLRELMSLYELDALLALPQPKMHVPGADSVGRRRPMT